MVKKIVWMMAVSVMIMASEAKKPARWYDRFWSAKPPKAQHSPQKKATPLSASQPPVQPSKSSNQCLAQPAPAPEVEVVEDQQQEWRRAIKAGVQDLQDDQVRRKKYYAEMRADLLRRANAKVQKIKEGADAKNEQRPLVTRAYLRELQRELDDYKSQVKDTESLITRDREQLGLLEKQMSALRKSLLNARPDQFDKLRNQVADNEERWREITSNLQTRQELSEALNKQLQATQQDKEAAFQELKQQWFETFAAARGYVGTRVRDAQYLAGAAVPHFQNAIQWIHDYAQEEVDTGLKRAQQIQRLQSFIENRMRGVVEPDAERAFRRQALVEN